jgi:hypothetical protein
MNPKFPSVTAPSSTRRAACAARWRATPATAPQQRRAVDVDLPLAQCQTASDGALRPVGALVNQVLAVKADPTRIVAAGIFGWPLPGQEASARN